MQICTEFEADRCHVTRNYNNENPTFEFTLEKKDGFKSSTLGVIASNLALRLYSSLVSQNEPFEDIVVSLKTRDAHKMIKFAKSDISIYKTNIEPTINKFFENVATQNVSKIIDAFDTTAFKSSNILNYIDYIFNLEPRCGEYVNYTIEGFDLRPLYRSRQENLDHNHLPVIMILGKQLFKKCEVNYFLPVNFKTGKLLGINEATSPIAN